MLSIFAKSILFITSYIPLYIILFIQYYDFNDSILKQPLLLTLAIIIVVSFILLIVLLNKIKKQKIMLRTIEIRNATMAKETNLTYLLSNIIPLIAFDFTDRQQIISFLIIFFVLLMMYVKYNLTSYNPTTEVLGYTNYFAEIYMNDKKINDIIILSKTKFPHSNTYYNVKGVQVDNNFWIITKTIED